MKKFRFRKILALILSLMLILSFAACGSNGSGGEKTSEETGVGEEIHLKDKYGGKISEINLSIASPNDSHVHNLRYPFYYSVFNESNEYVDLDLDTDTAKYIPEEDMDFFLDFIENHDYSSKRTEDSVFTYYFVISFDGPGIVSAVGYDVFPEELNEVIDRLNSLCGEDVLEYPTTMIEDIPLFIYDETGLTEEDYPREDIESMLSSNGLLVMNEMFSNSSGFAGLMGSYYSSISNDNISDYKTTEIREATEISDEDFEIFVNAYMDKIDGDWSITHELDPEGLTMINIDDHPTRGYMYLAKATEVSEWQDEGLVLFDDYDGVYFYRMPSFEEGAFEDVKFIYNEDASCVLVAYDHSGTTDFDKYVEKFYSLKSDLAELSDDELKKYTSSTEEETEEPTEAEVVEEGEDITTLEEALAYNNAPSCIATVPSGVPNSIDQVTFSFDGIIVKMPEKISTLGTDWVIDGDMSEKDKELDSGDKATSYNYINSNYDDGFILDISAKNFADETVSYEDAWIQYFTCNLEFCKTDNYPEVILPGGITWGSSVQDVYDAYGEADRIFAVSTYIRVDYYFDQMHSKGISLTIDYDKGLTKVFIYSDFL